MSSRTFSRKKLDDQTLSDLLWAAYGTNAKGTRTIPTAKNQQNMRLYVVLKEGAYLYDGKKHQLDLITKDNLLPLFEEQDFMKDVPLVLVFATDAKDKWGELDAGASYQNVGLFAASKGLVAVVRGYFDMKGVAKGLKLKVGYKPTISMAVGSNI